jgi:glycosyltransferase involved in cell wall biosynthesis
VNARDTYRVIVAGQVPPPLHGQAIYIAQTIEMLSSVQRMRVEHLPFRFSRDLSDIRRARPGKLLEVLRVWKRALQMRLRGPLDCLLFPAGGPQRVPILRDLLLLPVLRLVTGKLVIVFHAGGVGSIFERLPAWLRVPLRKAYSNADAAIVLTQYGRSDALKLGIRRVCVVPNGLPDATGGLLLPPQIGGGPDAPVRLLYVGHMCPDKGVPDLIEACALLLHRYPRLQLTLVGEPSNPWTQADLRAEIDRHGLQGCVTCAGVQMGMGKWRIFAEADIVVVPTRAPYETSSLVLVEAMMWGLPVVVSRWQALPEVLGDNPGGVYAEAPYDAASLATALRTAIDARASWPDWGKRNRIRFEENYQLSAVAATLRGAILDILERDN